MLKSPRRIETAAAGVENAPSRQGGGPDDLRLALNMV